MLYINDIKRPYLENQRKIGMRLNEELNECKRAKCNQKPLNEVSINKAKNKSTIPISIYESSQCSIDKCRKELLKSMKIDFNNYLLFLKYTNRKLTNSELNLISDIKKLLNKQKKSNEDIKTTLKLIAKFYK
jgi:hypothetical protein